MSVKELTAEAALSGCVLRYDYRNPVSEAALSGCVLRSDYRNPVSEAALSGCVLRSDYPVSDDDKLQV